MSRAVIKSARYKYGLIFCSLIVTFCVLIKIEGFDELGAARVILGGYPLGRTILILTFVINISLIQYLNADQIVLMLKKNELLLIRYGKPEKLLCRLLKSILYQNIIYAFLILSASAISGILCGLPSFPVRIREVVELGSRGLLICAFFSLVQVILIIRLNEVNTFMAMLVFSVLCAFFSRIDIGIFTLFPMQPSGIRLGLNVILCMGYIASGTFLCFKIYQKYWHSFF